MRFLPKVAGILIFLTLPPTPFYLDCNLVEPDIRVLEILRLRVIDQAT